MLGQAWRQEYETDDHIGTTIRKQGEVDTGAQWLTNALFLPSKSLVCGICYPESGWVFPSQGV